MAFAILVVAIAVGIGVYIGLQQAKATKERIDQGIMIQREALFFKKAEIFTLHADWNTVWGALVNANYHGSISSGKQREGKCAAEYVGPSFTAQFGQLNTAEGESQKYRFCFTHWEAGKYGTPYGIDAMNALLTTIEKTLLSIDPGTKVSTEAVDYKTKAKFF